MNRPPSQPSQRGAAQTPDRLFVRGGAVAMGGRAIVLPGGSETGTSALVAALVRLGATYYAEQHVPIDSSGLAHPDPLQALSAEETGAEVGRTPAPVALIAAIEHREGSPLALRELSPDDGILILLHHARQADLQPEFALRAARGAAQQALALEGERDGAEQAAAWLIERLARLPRDGPPKPEPEPPPAMRFVTLVLELEGELVELAGKLDDAGIEAVLLNGADVRPALAHGFADAFSAEIEIPRAQMPRARGAMEWAGWQPMGSKGDARYFRHGAVVRVRPGSRAWRPARAPGQRHGSVPKGRLGFAEPEAAPVQGEPKGSLAPAPFDPGGVLRIGTVGTALQVAAEALTVVHTLRLRTREREFRGLPVQYGPGVFAFEAITERLVDAILESLPGEDADVRFVEVGTATGAVALSVARERPGAEVLATDVSVRALGWARRNRRRLGVRNVRFAQGSLLAPVPSAWRGRVSAISANPPLAPPGRTAELRDPVGWPVGTVTGPGADGLGLVRALARDAREVLAPDGYLHLQMQGRQGPWIAQCLDELGYEAEIPPDASRQGTIEIAARWPAPS